VVSRWAICNTWRVKQHLLLQRELRWLSRLGNSIAESLSLTQPCSTIFSTSNNLPALQTFEFNTASDCAGDETKVTVEVRADKFSNDTSWQLVDYYTGKKLMSQRGYTLQPNEYRSKDICLTDGLYNFTIWDEYGKLCHDRDLSFSSLSLTYVFLFNVLGDGICCRYGEGFFKVSFDDDVVLAGGSFNANVSEVLNIGYKPKNNMVSTREKKYLTAHNRRRRKWYVSHGTS
jgi:hypothetical protein